MNYQYISPAKAPCNSFGCSAPAVGLCWRCHHACCVKHFYLVRWKVYETHMVEDEDDLATRGSLIQEDDGSLLCAECARRLPDISGKRWG